ncbi:LAP2A protein, partial [Onychorhynchus coronatus]|nr:LAP2A protein [Onychorhynchus coronatus]
SEDTESSCHRKVRPSTAPHFSESEKNSLMKSVIVPELSTILKDALTAARQSITSVAQVRSHSVKHPRVPITEVPVVPLEASGSSSQTFESDHMDSLKGQAAFGKEKSEPEKTSLEVESAPEDGEVASESPTEDQEGPDPLRKFDMENQNYLFKHIKRVLMLKPSKSECASEELLIPSEEGKVDNALPIHSAVEDLICRIWGNPEAKHEAPAVLRKLYPFPVDKAALWGTLPEVDRPLVTGDSVLSTHDNRDGLPDPTDKKIEEAIKRSFKLVAAQLGVSIYCTYASKALLIWLEEERARFKKKWVPSATMQRKRRLCKIAANFIHDAAEDSLRLTVKNMACLTVAWRAIWLRPWTSLLDLKCKLLSLPYTGGKLFGESLVQIMKDFSEHKHSLHLMKKKSSLGSCSFSYPHKCLSSLRSPKFKGGKGKYKVSQSFHAKYKKTSHSQRDTRPSRGTF